MSAGFDARVTSSFEDILARDGILVYKTHGMSMEPMLRQNRDLVVIRVPSSRLRKYDVALYRRNKDYVLHRVIGVCADHYLIRGDNTYAVENVPDEAVIGVLTGFRRKGKKYDVTDKRYHFYVRVWDAIYPLRAWYIRIRRFAVRAARKLGILPDVKNNTFHWLWCVTGSGKAYIFILTLIQAVQGGIGVIYALLLRAIVDSAAGKDAAAFQHNVILIIALVLIQLVISFVIRWLHELAKADIENTFKQRLVDNILRKDYASVSATHTAEWLNRLTNDTAVVAGGAVEILPGLVGTVVRLISALVMIIALDRWFAFILIPGGILLMLLTYAFRGVLKRLHKNIQESDGKLRIFLQERISNLMVIKAFAAEKQSGEGAGRAMEEHKAARLKRNRFSNIANVGFGAAMQGMYLVGIIYCAQGIMTGRVTYGTLTAIMQLIGQVQGPFASISAYLPRWYAMTASAERLMEIETFEDDGNVSDAETVRRYYEEHFHVLGLRQASFTYRPHGEEEMPVILDGLNLEIRKGETVAFTGHSGCGKSTVLKLLMCLYPPDSGERFIDGQELTASFRRLFAYVPQGNALMNGTIRDVISFAEPAAAQDDARIKRALAIACADEFVDDADAELGERGFGLSEGQMQRIAIARAIFTDAPILLLDESTSALDELTEKRLLENIRTLTDKTVIIVTHRKAALSICDRVIRFGEHGTRA